MTTTTETVTSQPSDYGLPDDQTRLRKGDVTKDGCIVMMVNESRALVAKLGDRGTTASIATTVSRDHVVERRGEQGLHDFLARKTPPAEAAAGETSNETTTETGDNTMTGKGKTKKATKSKKAPRGGLAADALAAQANGEAKPKGRKAKKPKEPKPANPPGEGRMTKIMGFSVCAVLRRLGKEGVTKEHAKAILEAQGITGMPPASLAIQVSYGKSGTRPPAELSNEQVAELVSSAAAPEPETKEKE